MRFRAVVFDLDGTLLDTIDDLADSMNAVLAGQGFPQHDVQAYKYFVGDGIINLAIRALPPEHRDEATVARAVEAQRQEYGRRWADKTRPYDGVPELLDALTGRDLPLCVLSNKPDNFTSVVVAKFLPRWKFHIVRGEGPATPKKPDPSGAIQIARDLNTPAADFLYVGDTNTDMLTAVAAGMFPIGALWGFRTARELLDSGAKALLERPVDLLKLL